MKYQEIIDCCYRGDGAAKLEMARELAGRYGNGLLREKIVVEKLTVLRRLAASLDAHMAAMDMGRTCSSCAARVDGGCCSFYMGNENNDALLLLMNILAGVEPSLVCGNRVECCFLGEKGCILLVKPIFCLNYLCSHIQDCTSTAELLELEKRSGALLTAQSELEQFLIRFMQTES